MSYLQCPECRLTVPAAAYYLRGDRCPRCLSAMEKRATFRSAQRQAATPTLGAALPLAGGAAASVPPSAPG